MGRNDEISFHHRQLFLTERHLRLSHCAGEILYMFFRAFLFDGETFRHPPCANVSIASFSDDGHNCWFSNPYCGAQFTCRDAAVIPNNPINLSLASAVAAMAGLPLRGLSPMSFSPLLKRRTQRLSLHLWHPHHTRFSDVYETVSERSLLL
jgi:hypothetical protein